MTEEETQQIWEDERENAIGTHLDRVIEVSRIAAKRLLELQAVGPITFGETGGLELDQELFDQLMVYVLTQARATLVDSNFDGVAHEVYRRFHHLDAREKAALRG